MTTVVAKQPDVALRTETVLAQGVIEKAYPGEQACTERNQFAKLDGWQEPADGGFAMKRGIITGALAERELVRYATDCGFTPNLGGVADEIISSLHLGPALLGRVPELRMTAVAWVSQWQAGFPFEDGNLDWGEVQSLLPPQSDLFLRRPEQFRIRVRPDNIVAVSDTLVAVEWSTSKDVASISPARFALNHHALLREQRRRPDWGRFTAVATRVEMLALGYGFTIQLSPEAAEGWRVSIGSTAEALMAGRYEKNEGPWCSTCPWQAPCWLSGEGTDSEPF